MLRHAEQYTACPGSLDEAAELLRAGNVTVLAGGTDLMPQTARRPLRRRAGADEHPARAGTAGHRGGRRRRAHRGAGHDHRAARQRAGARAARPAVAGLRPLRQRSDTQRRRRSAAISAMPRRPATRWCRCWRSMRRVVLASRPDGCRSRPVGCRSPQFLVGPGARGRAPDELLAAVEVPLPPAGFVGEFYKHGTRPALDIATISLAVGARRDGGGAARRARRVRRGGADADPRAAHRGRARGPRSRRRNRSTRRRRRRWPKSIPSPTCAPRTGTGASSSATCCRGCSPMSANCDIAFTLNGVKRRLSVPAGHERARDAARRSSA